MLTVVYTVSSGRQVPDPHLPALAKNPTGPGKMGLEALHLPRVLTTGHLESRSLLCT